MAKQLIVTAHDFGLCSSVNDGILYAIKHPNSFITEIALLPNAPGSNEAARLASSLEQSISLSFNITTFRPLSSHVPTLVDEEGNFKKVDIITWDFSVLEQFSEEDIRRELDAQVDWFIEHVGKKPSALLSRKNEHGDPKVLIPFIEKAKFLGIPVRTPVWQWKENYGAQSYVTQEGVPSTNTVVLSFLSWKGPNGYNLEKDMERFIKEVTEQEGISELIVPVGFVDEELFQLSAVNWERAQLFSLLDNDEIYRKLTNSFHLISYRDIRPSPKKLKTISHNSIHIRPANKNDFSSFISIQKQDGFPHAYSLQKSRLQKLFDRGELFFVAIYKNKPIGFASVDCEIRARIHFLCVDKQYTGNGIGSMLMKTILQEVQKQGYHTAHTFVEKKSSKEVFLQKHSFQLIGVYHNRYGPNKDATIWEIQLDKK